MPEIGQTIAHYRILEKIGQGGMGEVYLAEDLSLDRKVALKFLPDIFTGDQERMARFEREAKLLASLNHPNIAAIYGLEKADGKRFLIMEYVEGETLQARISKGALSVEDSLALCRQIAEGLEAAHEKGVIHRDLKPANVMITGEEKVKILDFGLAKALSDETQSIDSSQSPTLTEAMTQPGVILGTAAYMSPEQAKGKSFDKRSDIWAFGCILYECLTGKKAFKGETVTETLASIIKEEPDIEKAPLNTRLLLQQCLAKDRKNRLRDIGDAMALIVSAPKVVKSIPARRTWLVWCVGCASLVCLIASGLLFFRKARIPEFQLQIVTPPTSDPTSFSLSPDGHILVFAALREGQKLLWMRKIDDVSAKPLDGTEGASFPFWSPDSRSVGFFAEGKLKRIDVAGGSPKELAKAPSGAGGTWNRDGVIVFAPKYMGQLYRVPARGGEDPVAATELDPGMQGHIYPQFLPDGRHMLFISWGADQALFLGSLDSGKISRIISADSRMTYAPEGYLLSMREGILYAQKFAVDAGKVTGDQTPIAGSVAFGRNLMESGVAISETGLLAYRMGGSDRGGLTWFNRSGKRIGTMERLYGFDFLEPELSPRDNRLLVTRKVQENTDIYVVDTVQGSPSRLTFNAALDGSAIWSPDGSQVVFDSERESAGDLYIMSSNTPGSEKLLWHSSLRKIPVDWSPDGRHIIYVQFDPKTFLDIWKLPLYGDRKPEPFIKTDNEEGDCQFSPDGRFLAYQSNESGIFEIYVTTFPDKDGLWQISEGGGIEARWDPKQKELFYIAPDGNMMSVSIRISGNTLEHGSPRILFPSDILGGGNPPLHQRQRYDVTPDGQRFLINTADESNVMPITVVSDWSRLLKK